MRLRERLAVSGEARADAVAVLDDVSFRTRPARLLADSEVPR